MAKANRIVKGEAWAMSKKTPLLEVATELAEFLEEAHQPELDAAHHGDARRRGAAPGVCSYCAALKRAARVIAREARRQA